MFSLHPVLKFSRTDNLFAQRKVILLERSIDVAPLRTVLLVALFRIALAFYVYLNIRSIVRTVFNIIFQFLFISTQIKGLIILTLGVFFIGPQKIPLHEKIQFFPTAPHTIHSKKRNIKYPPKRKAANPLKTTHLKH